MRYKTKETYLQVETSAGQINLKYKENSLEDFYILDRKKTIKGLPSEGWGVMFVR